MPFKKGQSGNPTGKRKGTKSRTTIEIQRALLKILDDNLETLINDLKELKPKERSPLLLKLAQHMIPAAVNPERLTEEQLAQVIEYLEKQRKDAQNINTTLKQ